ncbi:MAG TPA: hypothetical protein VNT60_09125 [Deinococcales bacterium]|nr:hypothetical protein [Deinococcales bacterium]
MNKRLATLTAALGLSALSFAAAQTSGTTPAATPTINPAAIAPRDPAVMPGQTAEQYLATARELAAQAAVAYPVPYVDKPLWYDAIQNAAAARNADRANMEAARFLAELYTTTQWWFMALVTWREVATMGALDADANRMAAMAAAKVGYIRLERGLANEAVPFFQESLRFQANPEVQALLARAQGTR